MTAPPLVPCYICRELLNPDSPYSEHLPEHGWAHDTCIEGDTYAARAEADERHEQEDESRGFL